MVLYGFVYIIIKMLQITDPLCLFLSPGSIRNLSRTCKDLLRVRTQIREQYYEEFLFSAKHAEGYKKQVNLTLLDKYTLEILLDGNIKLIPERYIRAQNNVIFSMPYVYSAFAKRGSADIIEFFVGAHIKQKIYFKFRSDIEYGAAEAGHLNIIKWTHSKIGFHKCECYKKNCPCVYAACEGYTDIIDYCVDDIQICNNYRLRNYAAKNGKYHVIAHLDKKENNYRMFDFGIAADAAKAGQVETLQWLKDNGYPLGSVLVKAAKNGHLPVIQWAKKNGYYLGKSALVEVAKGGHLPIIEWVTENNWNKCVLDIFLTHGTPEVIEWLKTNNRIL